MILKLIGIIYHRLKHDLPTIAITNRALSPESIGLGVFVKSAKSFDLALEIKKIRTKCKSFGYGLGRKRKVSLPAPLAIAGPLPAS